MGNTDQVSKFASRRVRCKSAAPKCPRPLETNFFLLQYPQNDTLMSTSGIQDNLVPREITTDRMIGHYNSVVKSVFCEYVRKYEFLMRTFVAKLVSC